MLLIALKLALTPTLIAAVTVAERRWGPAVGGLLVGLPLTSGPVALFFALEHGADFAARAACATVGGAAAASCFAFVFARVATWREWPMAVGAGVAVYLSAAAALSLAPEELVPTYTAVVALLVAGWWWLRGHADEMRARVTPAWDLLGRMTVSTAFVLVLTATAGSVGPKLSGLLSPLPVYAGVLGAFIQHAQGAAAVQRFFAAVIIGNIAFATFFLVLGLSLMHLGIAGSFLLATFVALLFQGLVGLVASRWARDSPLEAAT